MNDNCRIRGKRAATVGRGEEKSVSSFWVKQRVARNWIYTKTITRFLEEPTLACSPNCVTANLPERRGRFGGCLVHRRNEGKAREYKYCRAELKTDFLHDAQGKSIFSGGNKEDYFESGYIE